MPTRPQRAVRSGAAAATASTRGEAGAHRPFGVVLVRLRTAEVGEHAVAQILGDVAAELRDHGAAQRA